MTSADVVTKQFLKNKEVFADAFNFYLYGGERVIQPDRLHDVDTAEAAIPYGKDETGIKTQPIQKIWDSSYLVMEADNKVYMLCGIVSQNNAMPVKDGLYNALEYAAKLQKAAQDHRKEKNYGTEQEFLSGFHKDDKLIPVYTLVIYWGDGEWNAPRSLFEMMDGMDERDYYGLNDWKINLIVPAELSEKDIEKFNSDLGKTLLYIKNMQKPEEIEKISYDERYRRLTPEAVLVLNAIMNTDFPISEKEDTTDMCYAIEKIKEEGIEQGIEQGMEKGRVEEQRKFIVKMNSNGFSLDMIALASGKSIEEIEPILAENRVADI